MKLKGQRPSRPRMGISSTDGPRLCLAPLPHRASVSPLAKGSVISEELPALSPGPFLTSSSSSAHCRRLGRQMDGPVCRAGAEGERALPRSEGREEGSPSCEAGPCDPGWCPLSASWWSCLHGRKDECPDFSSACLVPISDCSQEHVAGLRLEQLAPDFSEVKVSP